MPGTASPSDPARADIGVIGGSGLYKFLDAVERVDIETPYGPPSDTITLAEVGGRRVAFLPRHGGGHTIPPHRINYRANLWALRSLGCSRVIGPCAVGSLRPQHAPGTAVVLDQFVDRTTQREATYFDGPEVAHLSAADPYCPELSPLTAAAAEAAGFPVARSGTLVVVEGPRFSTRSESRWFSAAGWDVVGMTGVPEVTLARELGMCYAGLAVVTDYDSGLEGDDSVPPVTQEEVMAVFGRTTERLRNALVRLIREIPSHRTCACAEAPQPLHA